MEKFRKISISGVKKILEWSPKLTKPIFFGNKNTFHGVTDPPDSFATLISVLSSLVVEISAVEIFNSQFKKYFLLIFGIQPNNSLIDLKFYPATK